VNLAAYGRTFFDRIDRIYKILIYFEAKLRWNNIAGNFNP
jgi:hypothetical protein